MIFSLHAMSKAAPQFVGVKTLEWHDEARNRPVVVELWYPTQKEGPLEEESDVWIHPKEVRNSPIMTRTTKYPLILMSHGHFGDRRYLSWLVESLVSNGFVVASVEHYGNAWRSFNPLLSLRFWERARDITYALNQLSKDPQLDLNKIGFIGYSLGGMTGLSLAGAKAENVKETLLSLKEELPEMEPEMLEQIDFTEAHGSFFEPRIRAMALLSPARFVFPTHSLKEVKLPVAIVASEGDEVLPFKQHAHQIITHLIPKKLKMLKEKVSHYVFLNRVSSKGKAVIRPNLQTAEIEKDRVLVHKEVSQFVADFFKEQLR